MSVGVQYLPSSSVEEWRAAEGHEEVSGLRMEEQPQSSSARIVMRANIQKAPTSELSDAGGPRHPAWQLTWPARIRSTES